MEGEESEGGEGDETGQDGEDDLNSTERDTNEVKIVSKTTERMNTCLLLDKLWRFLSFD